VFSEPSCRSANRLEVGPDDGVADLCAAREVLPHPGPHGGRRLAWNLVRRRRGALRPGKRSDPVEGEQTKDRQTDAQHRLEADGHGPLTRSVRDAVVQTSIAEGLHPATRVASRAVPNPVDRGSPRPCVMLIGRIVKDKLAHL
jgi:hypothetical protein